MGNHRLASRANLRAEVTRLEAENEQLACALVAICTERDATAAENLHLRAEIATRDAVTVPPAMRDTSHPADVATAPLDVEQLRDDWHADLGRWRAPRVISLQQRGTEA
ncbi:hypothetical protein [Streptomyces sp. NPDC007083]|uniref:hypothetical protein n=1 Tax=Streptomyces sp. NPDC007083 TaxID=3156913 RepID=UPI003404337B